MPIKALARRRRAWGVEFDREYLREMREIGVRRQDAESTSRCHGANQKVGVRALDPARSASVEKRRRVLVVFCVQFYVGKRSEMITQGLELLLASHAGQ